jgi:hypothetical protein
MAKRSNNKPPKRPVSALTVAEGDGLITAARGKIEEARVLLQKLHESQDAYVARNDPMEFRLCLSAFLTAARSILQVLCPDQIQGAWNWVIPAVSAVAGGDPRIRKRYDVLKAMRNQSVHAGPVDPSCTTKFLTDLEISTQFPGRPRNAAYESVMISRMPGQEPTRQGVTFFEIDGQKEPAVECCSKYLKLLTQLVDYRELNW